MGEDDWPFPIPVVKKDGAWYFDSAAGVEEMINRSVGENELATIQSCLAYVDAQQEYYLRNVQKDPLQHYANKLISSPGKKDGLYWPADGRRAAKPAGRRIRRCKSRRLPATRRAQGLAVSWLHLPGADAARDPMRPVARMTTW